MTDPIDASAYAATERRLAELLDTTREVVILQGEAILALEALALGVGGPGVRVLNLVSGPYGEVIGRWLARGGAEVQQLACPFDRALDPLAVERALAGDRFDVVSVVHAEAATGAVNPLDAIAGLAHAAGAIVLVDAVASVGAEPLAVDALELDLVAVGPQKGLSGPNGVCAVIAGEAGWAAIERNAAAPRESIVALLDVKRGWVDSGRTALPFYAYDHEMHALARTLDARAAEGLERCVARHRGARDGTRAGLRALGLEPWVADDREAAAVATLLAPPDGVAPAELLLAATLDGGSRGLLAPAPGPLSSQALRVNHTGDAAALGRVLETITALAAGLHRLGRPADAGPALAAAAGGFSAGLRATAGGVGPGPA